MYICKQVLATTMPDELGPVEGLDLELAYVEGFKKAVEVARENMDTSTMKGPSGGLDRDTWETVDRLESFLQEQEDAEEKADK